MGRQQTLIVYVHFLIVLDNAAIRLEAGVRGWHAVLYLFE